MAKPHTKKNPLAAQEVLIGNITRGEALAAGEGSLAYLASNDIARMLETYTHLMVGNAGNLNTSLAVGGTTTDGFYTLNADTGGTASHGASAWNLVTGTSSTAHAQITSARSLALAQGKRYVYTVQFTTPSANTQGYVFGYTNNTTNAFSSPPTNGVYFSVSANIVSINVVAASSVATFSTGITLAAATTYEFGLSFLWNTALAIAQGAAVADVEFWMATAAAGVLTPTKMTGVTGSMITNVPNIAGNLVAIFDEQNSAGSATTTAIQALIAERDR